MDRYDTDIFRKDLEELGIPLSERQLEQFLRYYEMLVEWNGRMNLTAITAYRDVLKKHFVDSLSLVKACDVNGAENLMDVGTGAGFPGLALKIAFPGLSVTLLDSLNKRIQFLEAVIEELGLEGVRTIHGRAEDSAKPGRLGGLRHPRHHRRPGPAQRRGEEGGRHGVLPCGGPVRGLYPRQRGRGHDCRRPVRGPPPG